MQSKLTGALLLSSVLLASVAVEATENDFGDPAVSSRVGGAGTAVLSAVVNANGGLVRGSGATSVIRTAAGNYRVIFSRNVRLCTYVATIGLSGAVGTEVNSSIDVAGDNLSVNGVFVDTENFAGVQVDRGFHLIVFCNQ